MPHEAGTLPESCDEIGRRFRADGLTKKMSPLNDAWRSQDLLPGFCMPETDLPFSRNHLG
jgi:hypothetical protein